MMGITTNLRRGLVTPWLWANWTSGIVSIQLAGNNGAMFLEQSVQPVPFINSVALRERPARDDGGDISASLTIAMDITNCQYFCQFCGKTEVEAFKDDLPGF